MIDLSAIAQGDALRAEIAAKTAAFEALHGPVETLPSLNRDKRIPYRITCPEKKQADRAKTVSTRKARTVAA